MIDIPRRGLMLVLSSPSGAGKTTISRALLDRDANLTMSISATTRPRRPGEVTGHDYLFVDAAEFENLRASDELLEHASVFGHSYGTPRKPVEEALSSGLDVLFDIDWQGTQQVAQNARADLVSIFILPPSADELHRRLRSRARDPEDVVASRMEEASSEISHWAEYDYIIINDEVEASLQSVESILRAERLRRDRRVGLAGFVAGLRAAL